MNTVLLGLGSNLGDRLANINTAIDNIGKLLNTRNICVSHIYETEPVGYLEQPPFLNAVLRIETALSATAVLGACLGIEACMGRERAIKNGPRTIDIDVLIYDGFKSDTYELTLPHPRITQRAFVLVPLSDLYPSGRAPMLTFSHKLKNISLDGVCRYEKDADIYKEP